MRRLKHKREEVARLVFASGVALSLLAEAAAAAPKANDGEETKVEIPKVKWINVAVEGEWSGHEAGEFKFDRKVFEGFIETFRAHPHFKADDKGEGIVPVVPFDYEHVSELDPREGSVPLTGAISPAWALDLQVRDGKDEAGNPRAELWAKTKLGETIRNQIANDEYRFVSIAFNLESKDPKTDEAVGPRITSIAFTNHPFLRELAPLAASARMARGELAATTLGWYEAAGSVEDGMKFTRQVLGLGPTAGAEEIKGEIAKLVTLAADPVAAEKTNPGVKVGEMFADLRKIWGLTVTKTVAEIVAEIDKGLAQLSASVAVASGVNATISNAAAAAVTPPPAPNLSDTNPQGATMALSANLKNIVTLFRTKGIAGTRMLAEDTEVEEAVEDVVEDAEKNKKSLSDILASLGSANLDEALAQIPAIKAAAASAGELKSMLDEALAMNAEVDAAMSDADVAIAATSKNLPLEAVQASLSIHRQNFIEAEVKKVQDEAKAKGTMASPKALLDARKNGRRAFLTAYSVAPEGAEKLLKGIAAAPGGVVLKLGDRATETVGNTLLSAGGGSQPPGEKVVIKLSNFEGRGTVQKLLSWAKTQDDLKSLPHDKLHSRLSSIRAEANQKDSRYVIVDGAN